MSNILRLGVKFGTLPPKHRDAAVRDLFWKNHFITYRYVVQYYLRYALCARRESCVYFISFAYDATEGKIYAYLNHKKTF